MAPASQRSANLSLAAVAPIPLSPSHDDAEAIPINWTVELLDLPVKITLEIVSLTRPDGFEPFLLTCKAIYDLAKSTGLLEEHNAVKRQYEKWEICPLLGVPPAEDDSHPWDIHPTELLCAIRKNPLIAQYIRCVNLNPRDLVDACDEVKERWESAKAELRANDALRDMLQSSFIMQEAEQDIDAWHEAILGDANQVDFSFIFLLTLLTHVTHLRCSRRWGYMSNDDLAVNPINHSFNIDRVVHLFSSPRVQSRPDAPLSRLAVLEPWGPDPPNATPLQIFAPFLSLPSVSKMIIFRMQADDQYDRFIWPWGNPRASPLHEIEFTESAINAKYMKSFMAPFHNLKAVRYAHSNFRYDRWDAGASLAALSTMQSAKTLEELSFSMSYQWQRWSFSATSTFKRFTSLIDLELDIKMLLYKGDHGRLEPTNCRLIDILPPTIRRLRLLAQSDTLKWDTKFKRSARLFDGLVRQKKKLPNLRNVQLVGPWIEPGRLTPLRTFSPRRRGRRQAESKVQVESWVQATPDWLPDLIEQTPSVGIKFEYKQGSPSPKHTVHAGPEDWEYATYY